MKTYVISLARAQERAEYILNHVQECKLDYKIIDAIDGNKLTNEDLLKNCDMKEVNELRWWLNNGAIGCALSHRNAYIDFLKTDDESAFIIEDDVVLPENITDKIEEIGSQLLDNEVVLLYYTSFEPCKLSEVGSIELSDSQLLYPMNIRQTITAAAYIISRAAAKALVDSIIPIKVTADCWYHFHEQKVLNSLRVQYPSFVNTKNFKSSIDYFPQNSIKGKIAKMIDKYKFPFAYQWVRRNRKKRLNSMLGHFTLTNEVSDIYTKLIEEK
ncbi:MAG: glycosyl transferase family 25 [Patiriisocius sp.]|jgi:glycosyl transferase family 25